MTTYGRIDTAFPATGHVCLYFTPVLSSHVYRRPRRIWHNSRRSAQRHRAREAHIAPGRGLGGLVEGVWRGAGLGARRRAPLPEAPRRDVVADVVVHRLLDRDLEARLRLAALLQEGGGGAGGVSSGSRETEPEMEWGGCGDGDSRGGG